MKTFRILFAFLIIIGIAHQVNIAATESWVKVGLVFGSESSNALTIHSDNGFVFSAVQQTDQVFPLYDLSPHKRLQIYKGQYHITIGQPFATLELAEKAMQELIALTDSLYLSYNGQWYITAGHYTTLSQASDDIGVFKSIYPQIEASVSDYVGSYVILYAEGTPVFAYDTASTDFLLYAPLATFNGTTYRNGFLVKRMKNSDLTLINYLPMSEYLYGVVPKEMSGGWPLEALKAQAVAARNYALQNMGKYRAYGFDVCTTVSSQVYGGFTAEHPQANRAVDETKGLVLYYNDELVQCYYHAHSGGITEKSSVVWSADLPYLTNVHDVYALGAPNTDWTLTLTQREITEKLSIAGYDIGTLRMVRILEKSVSGRVTKIEFVGTNGRALLTKDLPRRIFGGTVLKSMLFSFDASKAVTAVPSQLSTPSIKALPIAMVSADPTLYTIQASTVKITSVSRGETTASFDKWRYLNGIESQYYRADMGEAVYAVNEEFVVTDGNVTFYGHGYGHGVGMSQWGAKNMADLGFDFITILQTYFVNTEIRGFPQ